MADKTQTMQADVLRARFAARLAQLYRQEVPQYAALEAVAGAVNAEVLAREPHRRAERLEGPRHGAIRLGTAQELALVGRLFKVFGLYPVGYYDLSPAGIPVHATAFRPVGQGALERAPFRMFTSLLRPELILNPLLRRAVVDQLSTRTLMSPRGLSLVEAAETRGGLAEAEADALIGEALDVFRWGREASTTLGVYQALREAHPLVADVACFKGPHINHLTVAALDIDAVQAALAARDMGAKAAIEGPPRRQAAILLRQTSFRAVAEPVRFIGGDSGLHAARFGEVEQRGAALTVKGRGLYDRLLAETARENGPGALERAFAAFPDDLETLRRQRLAHFRYSAAQPGRKLAGLDLEAALAGGAVVAEPIRYEDFLPVSAAGIFRSNLGDGAAGPDAWGADQAGFEAALGRGVLDSFSLYAAEERDSIAALGLEA